jgi:hypothetical protein
MTLAALASARAEHVGKVVSVAVLVAVKNVAIDRFLKIDQYQWHRWSEWQDLNLTFIGADLQHLRTTVTKTHFILVAPLA